MDKIQHVGFWKLEEGEVENSNGYGKWLVDKQKYE